ncbi:MAG: slipin family protein [Sphaerochaetaceae bacterium]|jgi:regulator of protease activity HflC (stomatin/prohibitin superfamily)|nr:slipin family protein [Sphaerochaetaceae bacterium]NLO61156.1 slipin family protein [Spirochaetales bacterium]MDD3669862.1 slipin family protein [Sphaerochaetaceae bacterium]MDD4260143.1 slipin family protein [Sphaerochaetaceae bacterium]MDD4763230.1 slipin family protein [Sphaerochaetaceae bacterium]
MNIFMKKFERIKNQKVFTLKKDFSFGALSFLVLALCLAIGITIVNTMYSAVFSQIIVYIAFAFIISGLIIALLSLWSTIIITVVLIWLALLGSFGLMMYPIALAGTVGLFFGASVQLILQWDKVIVLRMGKFKKAHGPGLLFLIPIIDRIAEFVDMRIRATDFSAEKTLTRDTVPVHVDAIAFWMIWDAKQAILEVEQYIEAVVLSAQTALRDAIGKHDLSALLSRREELGKEIQIALDAKTNPWGVTILSIEITDIIIPKELEDALSKQAQAEREKQSRVILAAAEVEIAKKFEEAAKEYEHNPVALQLRGMNMVYEGIRQNNSMMLMPASILDKMDLGATLGTAALHKIELGKKEQNDDQS